ncbi:MAG: translation initiation factor IF-3 [Mycoplasma sp.]
MAEKPKESSLPINEAIRIKNINVIDDQGENLGLMKTSDALLLAQSKNLDLVLISFKDNKAIAKILDYGKFKYTQKRKQKDARKNQTVVKNKEIKVKPLIGDHDLQVRANNTIKWLASGDRVTFIIESRGRMSTKPEFVKIVYDKFMDLLDGNGKVISEMKKVNNFRYETVIVPNKK